MQRKVSDLQEEISLTLMNGQTTIEQAAVVCNVDEIKQKHRDASEKWTTLKDELLKKSVQLEGIGHLSDLFNGQRDNLDAWITLTIDRLGWQHSSGQDMELVVKQLDDVQSWQMELMRRTTEADVLKKDGQKLMSLGDTDQEQVQKHLDDFDCKWNHLSTGD